MALILRTESHVNALLSFICSLGRSGYSNSEAVFHKIFPIQMSGSPIQAPGVFTTQPNIYNGAFSNCL